MDRLFGMLDAPEFNEIMAGYLEEIFNALSLCNAFLLFEFIFK